MPEDNVHTVLILGAGSNTEYGFPTGIELVQKIYDTFLPFYLSQAHSIVRVPEHTGRSDRCRSTSISDCSQYHRAPARYSSPAHRCNTAPAHRSPDPTSPDTR